MNYREANAPCVGEAAVREPESVMELIGKSHDLEKRIAETLSRMEKIYLDARQKKKKRRSRAASAIPVQCT